MASGGGNANEPDIFIPGNVIDDQFVVVSRLGKGGYGEIYKANRLADGVTIAIKVERMSKPGVLQEEYIIIQTLTQNGCKHIPKLLSCGIHENQVQYFSMELLGENLSVLRRRLPSHSLSLRCTASIAMMMLKGIKSVHDHGFLHRDIKPGNFVMGGTKYPREVFIIDYGLSRRYVRPNGTLRTERAEVRWVGSRRYMSPHTHLRKDQGRRDDLWSFLYVIIELRTGGLPWGHLRGINNLDKVRDIKMEHLDERLVQGLPEEFESIRKHISSLGFADRPDYRYIHNLLNTIYTREGGKPDTPFDWENTALSSSTLGVANLSFSSIHSVLGFSDSERENSNKSSTKQNRTIKASLDDDSIDIGTSSRKKKHVPKHNSTSHIHQNGSDEPTEGKVTRFLYLEDSADFSEESSVRRRKRQAETQAQRAEAIRAAQLLEESKAATLPPQIKKKKRRRACIIS